MRFDEIDVRASFKIFGALGPNRSALGYSGSTINWVEGGSNGATYSILKNPGYNYFIISATGTSTENAQGVIDAISYAQSNWSGAPAVDNRFTIFLTPGNYEFNTNLVMSDYVDLVGMSYNPYDQTIYGSGQLQYDGVNSGFNNLYLKDITTNSIDSSDYLRWENLAINGPIAQNWVYCNGEFEDIFVHDSSNFANATTEINAVFKNINVGKVSNIFNVSSGQIYGTFSNIYIMGIQEGRAFSAEGGVGILANFKNINVDSVSNSSLNYIFSADGDIKGNYENIRIGNMSNTSIFSSISSTLNLGDVTSRFVNISIGDLDTDGNAFFASKIRGIYKNISVGDIQNGNLFFGIGTASYYYNINSGNIKGKTFYNETLDQTVDGTFKKIKIKDSFTFLKTIDSEIRGNFDNIEVKTQIGFSSNKEILINIRNSKLMSSAVGSKNLFVSDDSPLVQVIMKNVKVIGCSNLIVNNKEDGEILADLRDVYVDSKNLVSVLKTPFFGVGAVLTSIGATISNLYFSDGSNMSSDFLRSDDIYGHINNIKARNVNGSVLYGNTSASKSTLEIRDVEVGNVGQNLVRGIASTLNSCKNLKSGNVGDSAFIGKIAISGFYSNLEIGNVVGSFFCATGNGGSIVANSVRDIRVGRVSGDAFTAYYTNPTLASSVTGTYKNINIISAQSAFSTKSDENGKGITVNIENLFVGTCSTIFRGRLEQASKLRNINVTGHLEGTIGAFDGIFGSIENSVINQKDRNLQPSRIDVEATIKRTKFLTHPSHPLNCATGSYYLSSFNYVANTEKGFTNSWFNIIRSDLE